MKIGTRVRRKADYIRRQLRWGYSLDRLDVAGVIVGIHKHGGLLVRWENETDPYITAPSILKEEK